MSTILKALRRLEEETSAQSQRPLREEVTHGSSSAKSRRAGRPLLVALLGLGVAAGVGGLAFWYLGRAPEPAQPTELAAAGSAEPPAEPTEAAPGPRKPRGMKPAPAGVRRPPPPAASEHELSAAALASKVAVMKRPPAQPRIAASEPSAPQASERPSRALPRAMDPAEIPGRHKRPGLRTPSALAAPLVAQPEAAVLSAGASAPEGASAPATSQVATATPVQEARPLAPAPPETEPRAEQPREAVSEPVVVAAVPQPEPLAEPAAPEPPSASGVKPARDAESLAAAPKPEPTYTGAAAEEFSTKPAKSSAAAPREREPAEAASSEITRAEIPGLRVERTVWHPIAERRIALIEFEQSAERREIREGDAVGPLVVSKIEPSGVVFVHEGVEVRRRIGE